MKSIESERQTLERQIPAAVVEDHMGFPERVGTIFNLSERN